MKTMNLNLGQALLCVATILASASAPAFAIEANAQAFGKQPVKFVQAKEDKNGNVYMTSAVLVPHKGKLFINLESGDEKNVIVISTTAKKIAKDEVAFKFADKRNHHGTGTRTRTTGGAVLTLNVEPNTLPNEMMVCAAKANDRLVPAEITRHDVLAWLSHKDGQMADHCDR